MARQNITIREKPQDVFKAPGGLGAQAGAKIIRGGGCLGLVAIAMAFRREVLRRDRRHRKLACVFACAGLIAELLYVYNEDLKNVLPNAFSVWMRNIHIGYTSGMSFDTTT
jgi:hypothetical protein